MENCLRHHGVKGQKWGVRRFQNKDGSYTSAGKKRRVMSEKKANRMINKINDKQRAKDVRDIYDQSKKSMTKKERTKENAIRIGAGAAYIASGAILGGYTGGKKGAGAMAGATAGQVAVMGLSYKAASKLSDNQFKKTDAKIKKLSDKLELNGYKVSEQKTYMNYAYNGRRIGSTTTKRYNLRGDTRPHLENYNVREQVYFY